MLEGDGKKEKKNYSFEWWTENNPEFSWNFVRNREHNYLLSKWILSKIHEPFWYNAMDSPRSIQIPVQPTAYSVFHSPRISINIFALGSKILRTFIDLLIEHVLLMTHLLINITCERERIITTYLAMTHSGTHEYHARMYNNNHAAGDKQPPRNNEL